MCLFELYTYSELSLVSQAKNELEIGVVLKADMVFLSEWVLVLLSLSIENTALHVLQMKLVLAPGKPNYHGFLQLWSY